MILKYIIFFKFYWVSEMRSHDYSVKQSYDKGRHFWRPVLVSGVFPVQRFS